MSRQVAKTLVKRDDGEVAADCRFAGHVVAETAHQVQRGLHGAADAVDLVGAQGTELSEFMALFCILSKPLYCFAFHNKNHPFVCM